MEANASINYTMNGFNQNITLGYTYLDEDLKTSKVNFSRYSINSLQHHATASFRTQFLKNFRQSIAYKFAKRTEGTDNDYHVVDVKATLDLQSFEISVIGNNIFNTNYTETNLVPMPKGNVLIAAKYKF